MLLLALKFLGWILAHTPESILRCISVLLGEFMFLCWRGRRRLILSNLDHAFPDRSENWHRRIGRTSCRRLVETGLLSLATPFLSDRRIRSIARLAPSVESLACELDHRPRPLVLGTAHFALWEAQTWLKRLSEIPLPEFGIIFRPLDHPTADAWVKSTRERFGMKLLSRKQGFAEALRILRAKGCIGILFDQNAGMQGALTLLCERVCSTTELPGVLATKFGADVRTFYPRRVGFWRVEFESTTISHDGTVKGITASLNRWLEGTLAADENLCASWLWAHDRWRNQDRPSHRLRLEAKRGFLDEDVGRRDGHRLPRRTRLWFRFPNWLGDVVMAVPLLAATRQSRPDAEITVVAKAQFIPLLSAWGVADRYVPIPRRGVRYWTHFLSLRRAYADTWILLTNSFRGDLEAWLAGARQRFGIVRKRKPRPLLTHSYALPENYLERDHHQLELWFDFLRHFGLNAPLDRSPIASSKQCETSGLGDPQSPIGLIPGSENNPEKRWPIDHWRKLIEAFPIRRFVIFGTANDVPITARVAAGFDAERVGNLAGKTDLALFALRLRGCRILVTNDTGGMHLANALGVPLIALFGPTNPIRTGPVFAPTATILQPPYCPPTGGGSLAALSPDTVIRSVHSLLADSPGTVRAVATWR